MPFSNRHGEGFENRLAQLVAAELGLRVEYAWWPQRRGFIRNTLKAGNCDVVMGLPLGFELAELTQPYYASTYVFVTRRADALEDLRSLDDPRLRRMLIGLHVIGDDYAGIPPADALAARGIVANVTGYSIYGDYSQPDPPRVLIDAVARGEVDVAIAWGPLAGYFAAASSQPLRVTPILEAPVRPGDEPLSFAIAMGVRHGDTARKERLQTVLDLRHDDVQALLEQFHVPLVAIEAAQRAAARDGPAPPRERLYVTNERSGELAVLDPQTRQTVARLPLGKRPRGLALSPDGRRLYVALSGSPIAGPGVDESHLPPPDKAADGIGVLDLERLTVDAVYRGVSDPEQVAVSGDGSKLYVASEDTAQAVVLDAKSGRVLATLDVGHEPEGIATSPDGRWVYVAAEADDAIHVIDTRSDTVVARIPTCARPRAIAFASQTRRAFVSCENSGQVAVVDTGSHEELRRVPIAGDGARPMGVALSPDERTLYVTTGRGGRLVALDTVTFDTRASVVVGARPWGLGISADGKRIYTANGPSNDVTIVDTDEFEVLGHLATGGSPWTVLSAGRSPAAGR